MKYLSDAFLTPILTTNGTKSVHKSIAFDRMKKGLSSEQIRFNCDTNSPEVNVNDILNRLKKIGYTTAVIEAGIYYYAILEDDDKECTKVVVSFFLIAHAFSVIITGDTSEAIKINDLFRNEFVIDGSIIKTATSIDEKGMITYSRNFIEKSNVEIARPCFYPYINVDLSEYFNAFMESDENILILYGAPGTGKSTFLRTLIAHKNYNAHLVYNDTLVVRPEVILNFYKSKSTILAYEDIDKHLGSREGGNTLMSTFLNATEGIVKEKGKKVIFSTNLNNIDKIDPALLRKGRCFDIIKFELLTVHEARAVEEEMKLEPQDLSSKDKWSLSEILNPPNVYQQSTTRYTKRIGFN